MKILRPYPDILAFYEGREGAGGAGNWVDDGALSLGVASYAIVSGAAALVYDTHVSVDRARHIRDYLAGLGVTDFTVLLSHHHLDHVAGNEAFSDCPVWATEKTLRHLQRRKERIEAGTQEGPPAINPLILPDHVFEGSMQLRIGDLTLDILEYDIHTDDEALVWIADRKILLAADALEDTITYVDEPGDLAVHSREIDRLERLGARHILPNHGNPERIAAGGYPPELCGATKAYIAALLGIAGGTVDAETPLAELVADSLESGAITWFDAYEDVHRLNVAAVLAESGGKA